MIDRLFKLPELKTVIANELEEAHLSLLRAQTAAEYARAIIQYNQERIARLSARIKEMEDAAAKTTL